MNIQLTQPNLQKALGTMSRVASSKTALPILSNVLIKTTDEGITRNDYFCIYNKG